ncbi:unnamed protein product [Rotaria magnacalcarata]|nr:unnamed protein product [Rotaria magnacalcarata]
MPSNVMIVFCVDNTTLMESNVIKVHEMILNISKEFKNKNNLYICIITLEASSRQWSQLRSGFTNTMSDVERFLRNNKPDNIYLSGGIPVGDLLHNALYVNWPFNGDNQTFNKKLVVLITDGVPNGLFSKLVGEDPWAKSKKFREHKITLAVVAVGNGNFGCDAFYSELAKNTGGLYILFVNAQRILQGVIRKAVIRKETFNKAFRLVPREYITISSFIFEEIKKCGNMNQVIELFREVSDKAYYDIIGDKFRF